MDGDKNQKWMELLRDYMIDNHISHTFWCLNPNSGDTGGLIGVDFKTWDDEKYGLFEPSLWQTQSSGKYIGLDHEVALGANGISLSDYYANYAASEGSNIDGGTKGTGNTDPKPPVTTKPVATTTKPVVTTKPAPTTAPPVVTTTPVVSDDILYGDANCDGDVTMADAASIYQSLGNPDKYGLSTKGAANADCSNAGDGITAADALAVQKFAAKLIDKLPEMTK